MRETIRDNAFRQGQEWTRSNEDNFRVPCSVCGKLMYMSSRDSNGEQKKAILHEAFKGWSHTNCQ
jgi:hypothetical protein